MDSDDVEKLNDSLRRQHKILDEINEKLRVKPTGDFPWHEPELFEGWVESEKMMNTRSWRHDPHGTVLFSGTEGKWRRLPNDARACDIECDSWRELRAEIIDRFEIFWRYKR